MGRRRDEGWWGVPCRPFRLDHSDLFTGPTLLQTSPDWFPACRSVSGVVTSFLLSFSGPLGLYYLQSRMSSEGTVVGLGSKVFSSVSESHPSSDRSSVALCPRPDPDRDPGPRVRNVTSVASPTPHRSSRFPVEPYLLRLPIDPSRDGRRPWGKTGSDLRVHDPHPRLGLLLVNLRNRVRTTTDSNLVGTSHTDWS